MTTWIASIRLAPEIKGRLTPPNQARILKSLAGQSAVLGINSDHIGMTLRVDADSASQAAVDAERLLRSAMEDSGLGEIDVVGQEVVTENRLIAEVVSAPEFLGLSELATSLGVSRQRAWQLTKDKGFPEPAFVLSATPVWRKGDVVSLIEYRAHKRRRGDHDAKRGA